MATPMFQEPTKRVADSKRARENSGKSSSPAYHIGKKYQKMLQSILLALKPVGRTRSTDASDSRRISSQELSNQIMTGAHLPEVLSFPERNKTISTEVHLTEAWQRANSSKRELDLAAMQDLINNTVHALPRARPCLIAIVAHYAARATCSSPELFGALSRATQESLDAFNPHDVANTVWAFATVNYAAPKLFDAVSEIAVERLTDFNPQNLVNTVWAFATLNHAAPKVFDVAAEIAAERLRDFDPQDVANVVRAFATLNHVAPKLFDAVVREPFYRRRIEDGLVQKLAANPLPGEIEDYVSFPYLLPHGSLWDHKSKSFEFRVDNKNLADIMSGLKNMGQNKFSVPVEQMNSLYNSVMVVASRRGEKVHRSQERRLTRMFENLQCLVHTQKWTIRSCLSSWVKWVPRKHMYLVDRLASLALDRGSNFAFFGNVGNRCIDTSNFIIMSDGSSRRDGRASAAWVILQLRKKDARRLIVFAAGAQILPIGTKSFDAEIYALDSAIHAMLKLSQGVQTFVPHGYDTILQQSEILEIINPVTKT